MGAFDDIVSAGQDFSETVMGGAFTYGAASLVGVFNLVEVEYIHAEFGTRMETRLVCVTGKAQWTAAGVSPANRGTLTYGGIGYAIEKIDGADDAGEQAFTLTLKRLT